LLRGVHHQFHPNQAIAAQKDCGAIQVAAQRYALSMTRRFDGRPAAAVVFASGGGTERQRGETEEAVNRDLARNFSRSSRNEKHERTR
jgi:hypothetical protein